MTTPRFHLGRRSAEDQLRGRTTAHKESFQPLPDPPGTAPYRVDLQDIIGADATKAIEEQGALTFHTVGDTGGIKEPRFQEDVAAAMERDYGSTPVPAFFYHLGDVVYFFGQRESYYDQFYDPYLQYPGPIFAIPGNHDGDITPEEDTEDPPETSSLDGFVTNFCAPPNTHTPEAKESPRNAMTQPNVYWTLLTPFATIVGLYTNVPEHGVVKADQEAWFIGEMEAAARDKALIVAAHHPVYSADAHHGSSPNIGELLDKAFDKAGRAADLVLNGHVHNYQRFTRQYKEKSLMYVVAGAGGYHNLHYMAHVEGAPPPPEWFDEELGVVLNAYNDRDFGYLRLTVNKSTIQGVYTAVPRHQPPDGSLATNTSDTFTILL